jgi:hypothetical protein
MTTIKLSQARVTIMPLESLIKLLQICNQKHSLDFRGVKEQMQRKEEVDSGIVQMKIRLVMKTSSSWIQLLMVKLI